MAVDARAVAALAGGHHREAVELYKDLLKRERRDEWVAGLASAYAGRAAELAEKEMFREALAVWRNRASMCGRPLAEGPYIDWLVRVGDHTAAFRLLGSEHELPPDALNALETRLAGAALTAPDSALAMLSADSPLLGHRAAARAAVSACCRGDTAALDEHLRAIPFRSPYRDLRFVLKSLLLVNSDPGQASALIDRLAGDSPFSRLAAVVRACVLPGSRWLLALPDLDGESRKLLLDLKGCPTQRRTLLLAIAQMAKRGVPPAPVQVLELLLPCARELPAAATYLCRRLLPMAPRLVNRYQAVFRSLSESEALCVRALASEVDSDFPAAARQWEQAADVFVQSDQRLPAALILRHISAWTSDDRRKGRPNPKVVEWLQCSVELDPDDRPAHLALIRLHREHNDLRSARASVDTALACFPDDPAVLLEAVETALAGAAFKKAVALAKRLLELDPINSRVRALIGQAHLSHARKQLRSRRPDAADKEIGLAEEWLRTAAERSQMKLLRGLGSTDRAATELLRTAVGELGGGLHATLQVVLESARLGEQPAAAMRRAGISGAGTPLPREVLAVVHAINSLPKSDDRHAALLWTFLAPPLRRGAQGEFSKAEQVLICETMLRCRQTLLLRAYAEAGLRRWPHWPPLVYLQAIAVYGRTAYFHLPDAARLNLEEAAAAARAEGDNRTATRIEELLLPPHDHPADVFGDDEDDDAFDALERQFAEAMLDPAKASATLHTMLAFLSEAGNAPAIINLAQSMLPDDEFRRLQRLAGSNKRKFANLLIESMLALSEEAARKAPPPPQPTATPTARPRTRPGKDKPSEEDDRQPRLFDD